jgi:glycosyltransferase involved in cell wall biosynthesis
VRLAIDARELAGRPTGVGRYLFSILREWARRPGFQHEVHLYSPAALDPAIVEGLAPLAFEPHVLPGSGGTAWEQLTLGAALRRDRPDLLWAPAYTAPLLVPCPVVLTIHDLSYVARPEWFRPRERWRRGLVTRAAATRARHVLTDSAFSRDEITRLLGVPATRISVIPLGLGLPAVAAKDAPRDPLILFAGSIFNRRRLPDLIAAFAPVAKTRPDARLVIVGENRTWPAQDLDAEIQRHGVAGAATFRSYVRDEELAALYARASVFAFLSEYEGFGLPPLEALAHGVPVVVLDTPVAREVYGDAGCFVPCGDIAGTAAALTTLLTDAGERTRRLDAAAALLPRYSWATAAAATLASIEQVGAQG